MTHPTQSISTEEQVAFLALKYQELVGPEHHKDRDCHWSIEKRWSYGEFVGYFVHHAGYCYSECGEHGEDGPFTTHMRALRALERHLIAAIAEVKTWSDAA